MSSRCAFFQRPADRMMGDFMKSLRRLSDRGALVFIAMLITLMVAILNPELGLSEALQKSNVGELELSCKQGTQANGVVDSWSAWSRCPDGYSVVGLGRLDITGKHENPLNHVNDLQCDDRGCRAWCFGNPCVVRARCCKITSKL